jgi:hypothetical protein
VGGQTTSGTAPTNCSSSNSGTSASSKCGEATDCVEGTSGSGSSGNSGANCAQPTSANGNIGSLPFTGQDLGLISLVGLMFLLAGFGLRRMTRRSGPVA